MGLKKVFDEINDREILMVKGVVEGVFFNKLPKALSFPNGKTGTVWSPTHSIRIVVDKVGVNLGLTDTEGSLSSKDKEGKYQDITVGAEVSIVVEEKPWSNGGKSGINYEAKPKDVKILKVGQPASQGNNASSGSQGASTPYKKRDDLPVRIGNAITAASYLAAKSKSKVPFEKVLDKAKEILPVIDAVREDLKAANPDMDDYALGARLGQCVTVAAQHYVKDVEDFSSVLPDMFNSVCDVETELRNPPKEETQEEEYDQSAPEGGENWDDEIPFATLLKNKEYLI